MGGSWEAKARFEDVPGPLTALTDYSRSSVPPVIWIFHMWVELHQQNVNLHKERSWLKSCGPMLGDVGCFLGRTEAVRKDMTDRWLNRNLRKLERSRWSQAKMGTQGETWRGESRSRAAIMAVGPQSSISLILYSPQLACLPGTLDWAGSSVHWVSLCGPGTVLLPLVKSFPAPMCLALCQCGKEAQSQLRKGASCKLLSYARI